MIPARVSAYPIPATDWQVQLGSLLMGDQTPYVIEQIDGLDLPPTRISDSDRAFTHGSFGGLDVSAVRQLVLDMTVIPRPGDPALPVLLNNLKSAFAPSLQDTGLTIQIPNWGQLLLVGRPRRAAFTTDSIWAAGRAGKGVVVQFTALDPVIYGAVLNDQQIFNPTAGVNAGQAFYQGGIAGMAFDPKRIIQNGGFEEATVAPWVTTVGSDLAAGATLTRDTGTFHSGVASGKVVTSGSASNQGVRQDTITSLLPNTSYTFSCWVNLTTAGGQVALLMRDLTNSVVFESGTKVTTTGTWQQISGAFVTGPTGPVQVEVTVRDEGTAVTRTFYVDDFRGDLTSSVQPYTAPSLYLGNTFGALSGGSSGYLAINNTGTAPSKPFTRIYGPVDTPIIEKVETGEFLKLNYVLGPNDFFELDHDLHTVFLNGLVNRQDLLDNSSNWWTLLPGVSTIHYRPFGVAAGSLAEVLWRPAWW